MHLWPSLEQNLRFHGNTSWLAWQTITFMCFVIALTVKNYTFHNNTFSQIMNFHMGYEKNMRSLLIPVSPKVLTILANQTQLFQLMLVTYLSMFDYIIKQLSTRHIFHHHKDVSWSTDHLVPEEEMVNKDMLNDCIYGLLQLFRKSTINIFFTIIIHQLKHA